MRQSSLRPRYRQKMRRAFVLTVAVMAGLAGLAHYAAWPTIPTFVLATVALAGLAWTVSTATEAVGSRLGPAATGVLQSTLGNLPELFIVIFALSAGETVVAQTSILGSVFANALCVLGLTIVAGCRHEKGQPMRFHPRLPNDTATLMLLASFVIVLIGISVASADSASHHLQAISVAGAVVLLVSYGVWLNGYLRSPQPAKADDSEGSAMALNWALILLAAGGVGSAFVSDWFVSALQPAMHSLHLSAAFAGLVVVGLAGNAVENAAAVVLASKGSHDLAISVVKNSVAQIVAFLFPALVLVSLLFAHTLTFSIAPVFIAALLLTGLALWQITGDGEATTFEGVALIGLFTILAVLALYE